AERATGAVKVVRPALVVLGLAEVRQDVGIAPAGVAEVAPPVVVLALAANVKQPVDRGRPAEHLAARLRYAPVGGAGLRFARVEPVHRRIGEVLSVPERDVDPRVAVFSPRLEQQPGVAAGRTEAGRQHATGGSGADHDEPVRPGCGWDLRAMRFHGQPLYSRALQRSIARCAPSAAVKGIRFIAEPDAS